MYLQKLNIRKDLALVGVWHFIAQEASSLLMASQSLAASLEIRGRRCSCRHCREGKPITVTHNQGMSLGILSQYNATRGGILY